MLLSNDVGCTLKELNSHGTYLLVYKMHIKVYKDMYNLYTSKTRLVSKKVKLPKIWFKIVSQYLEFDLLQHSKGDTETLLSAKR